VLRGSALLEETEGTIICSSIAGSSI